MTDNRWGGLGLPDQVPPEWGWLRDYHTWEPIRAATREEWQRSSVSTGWGAYDDGERIVCVTGGPPMTVYTIVTQVWTADVDWADHGPARRVIHDVDQADNVACREAQRVAVEMATWAPLSPWRVCVWAGGAGEGRPAAIWVSSSAVTVDDARRILAGVRRDDHYAYWAGQEYIEVVNRILSEEQAKNAAMAVEESDRHIMSAMLERAPGLDNDVANR